MPAYTCVTYFFLVFWISFDLRLSENNPNIGYSFINKGPKQQQTDSNFIHACKLMVATSFCCLLDAKLMWRSKLNLLTVLIGFPFKNKLTKFGTRDSYDKSTSCCTLCHVGALDGRFLSCHRTIYVSEQTDKEFTDLQTYLARPENVSLGTSPNYWIHI